MGSPRSTLIFANICRPMMVTVAKSIDAPIKLVFPRPDAAGSVSDRRQYAMLGLGDVVLPGIMIGLALRFDLFVFYLRQQKRTQADDAKMERRACSILASSARFSNILFCLLVTPIRIFNLLSYIDLPPFRWPPDSLRRLFLACIYFPDIPHTT